MVKWIRKVNHELSGFRIAIPLELIEKKGWQSCRFVTIDDSYGDYFLIGRLTNNDKKKRTDTDNKNGAD